MAPRRPTPSPTRQTSSMDFSSSSEGDEDESTDHSSSKDSRSECLRSECSNSSIAGTSLTSRASSSTDESSDSDSDDSAASDIEVYRSKDLGPKIATAHHTSKKQEMSARPESGSKLPRKSSLDKSPTVKIREVRKRDKNVRSPTQKARLHDKVRDPHISNGADINSHHPAKGVPSIMSIWTLSNTSRRKLSVDLSKAPKTASVACQTIPSTARQAVQQKEKRQPIHPVQRDLMKHTTSRCVQR